MRIVRPCDSDYDRSREGSNARFNNQEPLYICFCANDDDVREAMQLARDKELAVRVRSGRHHHEGMSSGNGVAIIDISAMNGIVIGDRGETVTVGAGAKLSEIYKRMDSARRILPGGGCGDVCVGGLVQGAGWGLYSRAFGMTCDQLLSFRMVGVDGTSRHVDRDSDSDLFWAVCGGGGGNFGVMTELQFKLNERPEKVWSVTLSWNKDTVATVVKKWVEKFPTSPDHRFTSFCRVTADDGSGKPEAPVVIAGNFLGGTSKDDVAGAMIDMLGPGLYYQAIPDIRETETPHVHPLYQPAPPPALPSGGPGDLTSTCEGIPYPHKVSSCFPRVPFGQTQFDAIAGYVTKSVPVAQARRYLSLHSLGGKVDDSVAGKGSSFF